MQEHILSAGEEWGGQKSTKFWPTKKHVEQKITVDPQYKQVFDTKGRTHYESRVGYQPDWRPSVGQIDFAKNHEIKRPSCKAAVNKVITDAKPRPQMKHIEQAPSGTYEDDEIGIRTFIHDNRKTIKEYHTENQMGRKKRIDFDQMRNGIGVNSLGDKKYKAVEYSEQFFHEGGLIAGSTHQVKIKSVGNAKAIDFYSGLKIDGPLNKDRVRWVDRVKKEERDTDIDAVTSLNDWEKTILKDVDPNYEISDDENAPARVEEPVPVKGKGKKK
ncbi:unnamed protein product [Moneuplotes crassus]|uniref:Uncharacterized protein n=2 Tax=Euplotes crassus TaxID=5936 RepID=A0AAD1XSL4_EUPCR|nr:unnamed protein product [Moneuplotes crassus]